MAGHSKWANIQHRKGRVDAQRGKLWSKLSKAIIVAAKQGGGDPDANIRLRKAIDDAKAQAAEIAEGLAAENIETEPDREIIAMIAYLQRLGTDIKAGTVMKGQP